MDLNIESTRLERCLDTVYDAAVAPGGWTAALSELATLFHAGFADICAWTPDRGHVNGLSVGLDTADYDGQMLGFWFNRNVWAKESPVRLAGEVISTRQMMPREDLRRSEMYHEYLDPRGLHEGLRLSLWVDAESLADMSLLRPWSRGAFGPDEVALGRTLLPHLQRAAHLSRRLRQAEVELDIGGAGGGTHDVAAIAFDRDGAPIWFNRRAEAMLTHGAGLRLIGQELCAVSVEATHRLATALARATGRSGGLRAASTVRLPWGAGATATTLVVQPLSQRREWGMARPPAALALFRDPSGTSLSVQMLRHLFGLTAAEARLALDLLAGLSLQEVAAQTGRSRNTLRSQLARLMDKTETTRQVDLVRLLADLDQFGAAGLDRRGGPDRKVDPKPCRQPMLS